jgi:hypothetical protein
MLTGIGACLSQAHQVKTMPPAALPHVCGVALAEWDNINMGAENQGSYTKIQ